MNKLLGMIAFILLILILLATYDETQNNQEMLLAVQECKKAKLRAVWIHNSEGVYVIQCRPYKKG